MIDNKLLGNKVNEITGYWFSIHFMNRRTSENKIPFSTVSRTDGNKRLFELRVGTNTYLLYFQGTS